MSGGAPIRFKDLQERGEWAQVYTQILSLLLSRRVGSEFASDVEPREQAAAEADAYTQAMRARGSVEAVERELSRARQVMMPGPRL